MPDPINRMKLEWWLCCATKILNQVAEAHGLDVDRVALIDAYNAVIPAAWSTERPSESS